MPNSDSKPAGDAPPAQASPAPAAAPAPPPSAAAGAATPKTVVAKLRCLDLRGETVHTRWGDVSFDRDGLSKVEVPEDELQMLRDIKPHSWLVEDHTSYNMARVEKKAKADGKR